MDIFIHRDGKEFGPYQVDDLRSFLATGRFTPADFAFRDGMTEWQPLSTFPEFAAVQPTAPKTAAKLPGLPLNSLGSYARATLQPDETPVFQTKVHPVVFAPAALGGVCVAVLLYLGAFAMIQGDYDYSVHGPVVRSLLIALLGLGVCLLPAYLYYLTSELVVTDRRLLIKVGWIRRRTVEMFVSKIESIGVDQGILGRIMNAGTVTVRGTGGSAEPFQTIARPIEFRNCVQRIQTQSERR